VQLNLAAITGFTYTSDNVAIQFDPTELQAVSVVSGTTAEGGFGSNLTTSATLDNSGGTIRIGQFFSGGTAPSINPGQVVDLADVTFQVIATNPGTTVLNIVPQIGVTQTQVNAGTVALNPAPTNSPNDTGVDGNINIVVRADQPPYNSLPLASAIPSVLYNPAARAGLQTATPNTVVFSSAGGDAITVSDVDFSTSGAAETTTVTVTGAGILGSTGLVGTLSATASGSAVVTNNGTSSITITGSPTDITATLNGLTYTPGAGFFGTTTLTVSTNDNGNSGFGGPLTDVRSTNLTVVGLFISEVDLLKSNVTNPSQYVEVFSTVPSYTIPTGVYLVGINGTAGTPAPGLVTDIFNLSGFATGTDGYLALLEKGEKYASGGAEVTGGNELDNSGTGLGFGSGATSKFGTTTGVHTGGTRPSPQLATDLLNQAESFLLIQAATAPTTTTNIDPANTGNPTNQTSAYNNWNVLDSVGFNNTASTSHSYAAITFEPTGGGSTLSGSNVVSTGFVPNYVGRIAQNTGSSSADWLASLVTGTASTGVFNLGAGTNSTQFAGAALNNIGGPNDWAPQMTVQVNDGSSNQHSQVAELTLTFSSPVNIADLVSEFQLKDASGNVLSITVTDLNNALTTAGATGPVPDPSTTQLFISFNAGSIDTFNFGTATFTDQFGNTPTVGLNDGNYFLNTKVSGIASAANSAVLLDGAHNGVSGSTTTGTGNLNGNGINEVDEFWRLFGDTMGRRQVDAEDLVNFGGTTTAAGANGTLMSNSGASATISAASQAVGGHAVTVTTTAASGFQIGEVVNITGLPAGYNGLFVITGVSGNTFTYNASSTGLAPFSGSGAATLNTYQWYLDFNEDGNIDVGNTLEQTQLTNRLFTKLTP
jgi:hypothetical protein